MGYGISDIGRHDEDVQLRAFGICACGHPLAGDDVLYEEAGTVSLAQLQTLAGQFAGYIRCHCGAWSGRSGSSFACYRLPGGPWLIAEAPLDLDADTQPQLTVRNDLPAPDKAAEVTGSLQPSELEAAERLGQPPSVRAAWQEALFWVGISAPQVRFPIGAGLRGVVSVDEQAPPGAFTLPADAAWLSDDHRDRMIEGGISCYAVGTPDTLEQEVIDEMRRCGLVVQPRARRALELTAGGPVTLTANTLAIVDRAVAAGLLPRLQAGYEAQAALLELEALHSAVEDIHATLRANSVHPAGGTRVTFTINPQTVTVDVAAWRNADTDDQRRALLEAAR